MPIEFQDVLKINVVLAGVVLLGEQHQREQFAELADSELVSEMLVSGPVPPPRPTIGGPANVAETGLLLNLLRDRIQLVSTPSRSSIERQYPKFDELSRLAEIAGYAIDLTDLKRQVQSACGFNIEMVYRQTAEKPSETYIAERLFSRHNFGIDECTLVGGGGKLSFQGKDARWNFAIEARANDPSGRKVYLSLNLHRDTQQVPNREEILNSLQDIWNRSHRFAAQFDASE